MSENVMWNYHEPFEGCVDVSDWVAFYQNKVDAWYEEEEELLIGPKDLYTRVDCFHSSRHVSVVVNGETVAATDRPVMLLETGQPHRYYIPKSDVRLDFLRESSKVMKSQYKGEASYFSVAIGDEVIEDLAWQYRYPLPEAAKVANHVCFPQGKVDLYVDGELQEKPNTRWDR